MKHKKTFTLALLISVLLTICMVKYSFLKPPFLNVSAVETAGYIIVYWDKNCTQKVYSISWGVLTPGETKGVVVYVRNEGNETCLLNLTPANWTPNNASNYLNFSWNCEDNKIEVDEIVKVTPSLLVSPNIVGVTDFGFDIIFEGRKYLLGDIDRDGFVYVNDLDLFGKAWYTRLGDPNYNPDCDFDNDGFIWVNDMDVFGRNWCKKAW